MIESLNSKKQIPKKIKNLKFWESSSIIHLVIDMKIINRKYYIDKLIALKNKPDIKIITGVRRAGKSVLLNEFSKYILSVEKDANIIRINFNLLAFDELKDFKKLNSYIRDKYIEGVNNYVFIDEVQMCPKFELAINDLYETHDFDIYITGSNAFLLSSDLATLFTGRYFELEVFPFSFQEFCEYYNLFDDSKALEKYVKYGGFSGSYVYENDEDKMKYISNVLNVVVLKDIMKKNGVTDVVAMDNILSFLLDNISILTTANKVSSRLNSDGVLIDHKTVGNYISYLCSGYVFHKIKRYDIKGSLYLQTNEKYYCIDQSFRLAKLGTRYFDFGRIYENIVAIELLRRGYEVYVGKLYQKEIDFVAIKGNDKIYIQVADNIENPETLERELSPLKAIRENYTKIILANTKHFEYDISGIKIIDLSSWLLDNKIN